MQMVGIVVRVVDSGGVGQVDGVQAEVKTTPISCHRAPWFLVCIETSNQWGR